MSRERRHYPYRVAQRYLPFFQRFAPELKPTEQKEVIRAASYVLEKIERLPNDRQHHRSVVECKNAMELVLSMTVE
jgi:hypothetical protein